MRKNYPILGNKTEKMTIGPFKAIPEDYLVSPKGQLILQGQVSLFDLILTID